MTISNRFKELKKTMDNELKETKKMMSHQEESINKEIEIVKRNEIEILELKSTITEIKNSLKWFITNLDVKKIDRGRRIFEEILAKM